MGTIVEKTVTMGVEEWRAMAEKARTLAVRYVNDDAMLEPGGAGRNLKSAADLLKAASTFDGRANMAELLGSEPDVATVDVWDLSDEQDSDPDAPAWPAMSAKLREFAGANPKLLPMVEQIDRLHEMAVEKGLPQVTVGQLEEALAAA